MLAAFSRIDVMIRMLALAVLLASIVPATGDARPIAQAISNTGIFLLFFLNGVRLSRTDIMKGMGNARFLIAITIWCYGMMSLAGLALYWLGAQVLPPLVALGMLFLGTLPSTVQSAAAYTSMAKGNVASSVVTAALLNILGVFVAAPIFAWLSGGAFVELGLDGLTKLFLILILPFALGQVLQNRLGGWLAERKSLIGWMDRTAISIAVYVAFSGAVEQDFWGQLDIAGWGWVMALLCVLLVFAYGGSWALSGLLRLDYADRISFMFAGAHKSVATGAPLALVMFSPEVAGLILVPLLIYHLLQLVVSAPIANRLAARVRT